MSTPVQQLPDSIATMVNYWDRLKSGMDVSKMDGKPMDDTALSKALGISFQAVAKVRKGGSFGSKNNLKAAKLFNFNPEWLATGKGEKYAIYSQNHDQIRNPPKVEEVGPLYNAVDYRKNSARQSIVDVAKAISLMDPASRNGLFPLFSALIIGPDSLETIDAIVQYIEKAPEKVREPPEKHGGPAPSSSRNGTA